MRRAKLEPIVDFKNKPPFVVDRKLLDLTTEHLGNARKDLDWLDDVLSELFPPDRMIVSPEQ